MLLRFQLNGITFAIFSLECCIKDLQYLPYMYCRKKACFVSRTNIFFQNTRRQNKSSYFSSRNVLNCTMRLWNLSSGDGSFRKLSVLWPFSLKIHPTERSCISYFIYLLSNIKKIIAERALDRSYSFSPCIEIEASAAR